MFLYIILSHLGSVDQIWWSLTREKFSANPFLLVLHHAFLAQKLYFMWCSRAAPFNALFSPFLFDLLWALHTTDRHSQFHRFLIFLKNVQFFVCSFHKWFIFLKTNERTNKCVKYFLGVLGMSFIVYCCGIQLVNHWVNVRPFECAAKRPAVIETFWLRIWLFIACGSH